MSKLIKKYKENYRNFLGIFKGLFEHAGVQLAKYNTHTQERGVNIAYWKKRQEKRWAWVELERVNGLWAWVIEMDSGMGWYIRILASFFDHLLQTKRKKT
jgi:hypothetical protein